jgi:hypothetical protein
MAPLANDGLKIVTAAARQDGGAAVHQAATDERGRMRARGRRLRSEAPSIEDDNRPLL